MNNENASDLRRKIILPDKKSDLAELYGILTGDGYINFYEKRQAYLIEISGNKLKDLNYLNLYVRSLIKSLYNLEPSLNYSKDQNTIRLILRSKMILNHLKKLGFPLGRKKGITSPKWITNNEVFFKRFIRGVFDTDGYLCLKNKEGKKYPVIGISSISRLLLSSIQDYLSKYKITSYLGTSVDKSARYKKTLTINKLQISGLKNVKSFYEMIGSKNNRNLIKYNQMMGVGGIEPPTLRASVACSPTELHSLNIAKYE